MSDQPATTVEVKPAQNSILAALLGLLLPGAGQIYNRQDNKGIFLVGFFLLGHWATGGISSLVLCPAMSADAFMIARKINRGEQIERWEFFPAIKPLNKLPPLIMPLAIVILIAAITLARIVIYASDYRVGE